MTTAIQAYNLYMTTRKHFSSLKYSAFKDKPIKIPESKFLYRPERYRIKKLADRFLSSKDLIQYYVANFSLGTPNFIYDLDEVGESSHLRWESYKQSLSYNFKNDYNLLSTIAESKQISIKDLLEFESNLVLNLVQCNKINLQSLVILDQVKKYLTEWINNDSISSLHNGLIMRIYKTRGFIKADETIISHITRGLEAVEYE